MKYDWIIFDADETLFHFDSFAGLQLMFKKLNVDFIEEDYHQYQSVNKPLWVDYQNGVITAEQLQHRRFNRWAEKLNDAPGHLNSLFLDAMAEICRPIDGAENLLHSLKGRARLGIITNGFTELQLIRLERTGLKEHFEFLVISEQVGVAKPHRDIFDHALAIMGNPDPKKVLMVGDNLQSDILGGLNAGMDTCWVNLDNKLIPEEIIPHYQVTSLFELQELLKL